MGTATGVRLLPRDHGLGGNSLSLVDVGGTTVGRSAGRARLRTLRTLDSPLELY